MWGERSSMCLTNTSAMAHQIIRRDRGIVIVYEDLSHGERLRVPHLFIPFKSESFNRAYFSSPADRQHASPSNFGSWRWSLADRILRTESRMLLQNSGICHPPFRHLTYTFLGIIPLFTFLAYQYLSTFVLKSLNASLGFPAAP